MRPCSASPAGASGIATFLILGERCTRDCAFCAIGHGPPEGPDPAEGARIAAFIRSHSIRFAVLTSVTREDLEDGGAAHFERVVRDIRGQLPEVGLELLVPDFGGRPGTAERLAGLHIQVFAHNMETVRELYPDIRRGADYGRSLEVLRRAARARTPGLRVKSGIMVGLGEQPGQLQELFADLAAAGAQILTIGQYLRPTGFNAPVVRYYNPEEFEAFSPRSKRMTGAYVLEPIAGVLQFDHVKQHGLVAYPIEKQSFIKRSHQNHK